MPEVDIVPIAPTQEKLTSESWLDEYALLARYLTDIKRCLNLRDGHAARGDMNAYQNSRLQALKAIRSATSRHMRLQSSLQVFASNSKTDSIKAPTPLSKLEMTRRQNLIENLKSDLEKLDADSQVSRNSPSSNRSQLLNPSSRSTRKFGVAQETEETRALDNSSLLLLQRTTMETQDDVLGTLLTVVQRQKEIGMQMSQELDLQNSLLDDVDEKVAKVNTKLNISDKKIKRILKG